MLDSLAASETGLAHLREFGVTAILYVQEDWALPWSYLTFTMLVKLPMHISLKVTFSVTLNI